MADYQQIVDEIRYALQSENCELTDALQLAAQEYSQACREVNLQLRKIGTYLDGGLRSEAIQLAEGPPNVEDLVNILNFPEQEEWADVVAIYDLPRNEPLNLRVIEQLNDAQVVELPLQSLMSRHRLLALHRAPLKMRLGVLRELLVSDPETFSWEEDVREFEKARLQEISQECRTAQREGNFSQLRQLHVEVSSEDWLETPPTGLIKTIKASAAELTRQSAQRGLVEVSAELEQAFNELDLPRARGLATRWKELERQAGQNVSPALTQQVTPILGWVQDELEREAAEKQFKSLIARLEHSLDQSGDLEELDQLVHEINRLERGIPELLAIRYRNQREAIQLTRARTYRLQFGTAMAVVVVIAVGVGFLVRNQVAANEVQRLADHINRLLDEQQFEEAESLLGSRDDVLRWDPLAAVQTRLTSELRKDEERKAKLSSLLKSAGETESFRDSIEAIEQAQKLAITSDEKLKVADLKRAKEKAHNEAMAAREKAFNESVVSTRNILVSIHDGMGDGPGDQRVGELLGQATSLIEQLQVNVQGMRPEFSSQLRLLVARHKELDDLRRQRMTYQQRAQELTTRAGIASDVSKPDEAVDQYRVALLAFADVLPQEQAADLYRKAAAEETSWKSAMRWAKQSSSWDEVWPRDLTVMAARVKECQQFLTDNPGAPDTAVVKRYLEQLEANVSITGHVNGSGEGLQSRLLRVFSSALVERSWCLKTRDGRVFYVPKKMTIASSGLPNFPFLVGYGDEDVEIQKRVPPADLISLEATPSPCQLLARHVKDRLSTLSPEEWNSFCLDLTKRILEEQDLNDFLKLDLLKRCLELAANGDVFLKEQLEPHLKQVQAAAINPLARWMNPDDSDGVKATNDARQVLSHFRRLKDLGEVWKAADQQRLRFQDLMKRPTCMVGWLQPGNSWTCHVDRSRPLPDADLLVTFTPAGGDSSEWRNIGQILKEEIILKPEASAFLAAGRPVFSLRKENTGMPSVSLNRE